MAVGGKVSSDKVSSADTDISGAAENVDSSAKASVVYAFSVVVASEALLVVASEGKGGDGCDSLSGDETTATACDDDEEEGPLGTSVTAYSIHIFAHILITD